MSSDSSDTQKSSVSADIRKYLLDKSVAPLMEKFMGDLIQHRPDDVLGFLKQWAIEQHALAVGLADTAREEAKESEAAAVAPPGSDVTTTLATESGPP